MNDDTLLKNIEGVLSSQQMDCAILNADEVVSYPRLLLYAGKDYKDRERVIEITAQSQLFTALPNTKEGSSQEHYARIQFQFEFPYQVHDQFVSDLSSLVHFINRSIDFPGFEFNELNNKLFYRHVLLTSSSQKDQSLYVAIAGLILMSLDLFTETLESVAQGHSTFNELLEKVVQLGKDLR